MSVINPLPIMVKYLHGKPLTKDENELLLFSLYIENYHAKGPLTNAALRGKNVLVQCICGKELELE